MTESSVFTCHSCGSVVSEMDDFCRTCIAPVNVAKLSDFGFEDHIQLFTALVDVLGDALNTSIFTKRPWLASYLNCFWMRPETAMYMAAEYEALQKLSDNDDFFVDIDLGCGDGIHSSIINGWDFVDEFDAFGNLDITGRDVFDSTPQYHKSSIVKKNGIPILLGVDIKENSIARAKTLGSFQKLNCSNIVSDKVDGSFESCFSNLVRDFADNELNIVLRKIPNLLAQDASFCFSAPTKNFKHNLYFFPKMEEAVYPIEREILQRLNRGRSDFCVQQISTEEWEQKLGLVGLEIENVTYFGSKKFTQFWDTGMRGFINILAPYLSSGAPPSRRHLMKSIFIKYWSTQISAILDLEVSENTASFQMIKARLKN